MTFKAPPRSSSKALDQPMRHVCNQLLHLLEAGRSCCASAHARLEHELAQQRQLLACVGVGRRGEQAAELAHAAVLVDGVRRRQAHRVAGALAHLPDSQESELPFESPNPNAIARRTGQLALSRTSQTQGAGVQVDARMHLSCMVRDRLPATLPLSSAR